MTAPDETAVPQEPAPAVGLPTVDELAFDVADLPGGAHAAVEAVLMVADEPVAAVQLATVLGLPTHEVEACSPSSRPSTAARAAPARVASSCGRRAAAGVCTRPPRAVNAFTNFRDSCA